MNKQIKQISDKYPAPYVFIGDVDIYNNTELEFIKTEWFSLHEYGFEGWTPKEPSRFEMMLHERMISKALTGDGEFVDRIRNKNLH